MDCPKFEKSKGYKSKIPVRAIKPPSRLPVPSAAKENELKKNYTRPNPPAIENVSSTAQVKAKKAILVSTSRKGIPPLSTRFDYKDSIKTVTNRRLTNAANPAVNKKSTSSELQKVTKGSNQLTNKNHLNKEIVTENKRFTYAANPVVNKKSAISELPKVTKGSNQLASKKPLNKEVVTENKRFTYAASRNQNDKPTSGKIIDINKRFTNISNKGSKLLNKNTTVVQKNIENRNIANVDKIETKRHTNFGYQTNYKKQLVGKQPKERLPSKESTFVGDDNLNIKSEKDVSFDQNSNCPSDIQDPSQSVDKENKDENHFFQPDVEFVADERYRNQILFGQGISPKSKPQPVKNSLISDRPSFFLKSKTALRALEKLEEEGRRASMMRMSGLLPTLLSRPSQATKIDPCQAVLRALENVDLVAEDRRVSAMKKNNIYFGSPRRDRSPMVKQQIDPCKTALKKIEALQMKRKAKSAKKVTFNLELSDSAPKVSKQSGKFNIKNLEEVKPDVIREEQKKYDQSSILKLKPKDLTPELQLPTNSASVADKTERILTQSHYHAMILLRIHDQANTQNKADTDLSNKQTKSTMISDGFDSSSNLNNLLAQKNKSSPPKSILRSQNATKFGSKISDSVGPCFEIRNKITSSILTPEDPRCSFHLSRPQTVPESDTRRSTLSSYSLLSTLKNKTSPLKSILKPQNALKISSNISDSVGPCFRTLNRITSSILASEDPRCSFLLSRPQAFLLESNTKQSTLSRLCTPKPISLFPKPCATNSISPEFLCRRTSQIVAPAPISTPMVMRTLAANLEETLSPSPLEEESPVCLRLDFDEIAKEIAVEAAPGSGSPKKILKWPIQNIRTNKQILDTLADEECSAILSVASFPVITQRSVWNPVAQILTHGDDMHFVPLKLK